ncbi:membrane fusion protein (multidrug efflux system) [Ereboglobus sp. PH5-10]|uniref:efflux RND transporter periplasmic adaptor subunit n=1 Tax=Ereboglobus sp. PH5-10 TaxID=2940629 RepID=UPI0024075212|nr:efflux RND transporter periplasmic adaptor subunit [Ereboglobus sp. PH5-10]MDF9827081.1 membrane fusion protein (multidrug efflux system) [Ereboglobus sp. PH5-10]
MSLNRYLTRYKAVIFSVAVAVMFTLAGCGGKTKQEGATKSGAKGGGQTRVQPVEVAKIQRRDLVETLNLVGSLAANETAQIRAEIAGQIREVLFDEGQFVKQGQLLVRVDDAELRAQLAQSEAKRALASQNLKRIQSLVAQQLISEADADQARSDFDAATAEAEYLRVRVSKMEIKAPFDGIAGARTVSPGDYVTASVTATAITTIDDLSRLKIEFQVPERYSLRVKPGTKFRVRARTTEGEAQADGEVYFASAIIDRTTRSTQVKGYLDQIIEGLRPGMFVNIELELSTHKNVLVVPEGAILVTASTGPQIVVVRERGGEYFADFVPVEIGLRTRGLVEINIIKEGNNKAPVDESSRVVASGVGALILYQDGRLDPRPLRKEFTLGGDEL